MTEAVAGMAMVDELVEAIARDGRLSSDQASAAVAGVMRFFGARLPSPLFGELQAHLKADGSTTTDEPDADVQS